MRQLQLRFPDRQQNLERGSPVQPARDLDLAAKIMGWLRTRYPGYPWAVISDLAQGIVRFNIPIVMGVTHWYIVNLRTTTIEDGLVDGAGEILERYRLPRTHFNAGAFLQAREQHSKLVNPHRLVPT